MLFFLVSLLDNDYDKEKMEKLYYLYRDKMMYVALSLLKNPPDAENIVQDSFIAIIDHFDKIEDVNSSKTWSYIVTIVRNKSYNLLKRQNRDQKNVELDVIQETKGLHPTELEENVIESVDSKLDGRQMSQVLSELIGTLKPVYQDVLRLQYYNELSPNEIGRVLGKTPDNVRHISKRAKGKLNDLLYERGIRNE